MVSYSRCYLCNRILSTADVDSKCSTCRNKPVIQDPASQTIALQSRAITEWQDKCMLLETELHRLQEQVTGPARIEVDREKLKSAKFILTSILYHRDLQPQHFGTIEEWLGYPTQKEMLTFLQGSDND